MDNHLTSVYLKVLLDEAQKCLNAWHDFSLVLRKRSPMRTNEQARAQAEDIVGHSARIVTHAAAVSRLLWPEPWGNATKKERTQRRGETLRRELDLPDDHPVRSRSLRNHIEHFDQRLDEWAASSNSQSIIHNLIAPSHVSISNAIINTDIMHHIDPNNFNYTFRGDVFSLLDITTGVRDIKSRTEAWFTEERS